jgi:hypothetical protein
MKDMNLLHADPDCEANADIDPDPVYRMNANASLEHGQTLTIFSNYK